MHHNSYEPFKPAWWAKNPHLQTLWASKVRRKPPVPIRWERLELPDGDFLDLTWSDVIQNETKSPKPLVLLLHGLTGNINSRYARGMLQTVVKQGWRGVLMHFRGCSGTPNRLSRSYHSGETNDLQTVVSELFRREPHTPLFAVGYSLGGNVLLKWLAEYPNNPLKAAVAVSIPFELQKTSYRLNKGFSRVYRFRMLQDLIKSHQEKFKTISPPFDFGNVRKMRTFREFDDAVTAPLHGFKSADDYYSKCSSRQFLSAIQTPTLIIHAKDDPFTTLDALPSIHEVSSKVTLELTERGGHVGFVSGKYPWKASYWLENRISHYLDEHL